MRGPNHTTLDPSTPLTPAGKILEITVPSIPTSDPLPGRPALNGGGKASKPVIRLTTIKEAKTISNEAELINRKVVIVKAPCVGLQGKIVKVVTAEKINEESHTKGHRDVFYTVETDERYITGIQWQDFLQIPRP